MSRIVTAALRVYKTLQHLITTERGRVCAGGHATMQGAVVMFWQTSLASRPVPYCILETRLIWPTEKTAATLCLYVEPHKFSHRLIYKISFFHAHTHGLKTGHTHSVVHKWYGVFKLQVFEAGDCINQSWHLLYDSLVSRVTPRPCDKWPLLPHGSFKTVQNK